MLFGESLAHVTAINGGFIEYLRGSHSRIYGSAQRHATALYVGSQVIAQSGAGGVSEASFEMVNSSGWPTFSHCFAYACGHAEVDLSLGFFSGAGYGTRKVQDLGGLVSLPAGAPGNMT